MFLSREHGAARHGMVNENGKRKRKNVEERIKNSHNDITQSLLHKIEAFLLILPLSVTRQSRTPAASCGKKLLFGHLCPCLSKGQVGHLINSSLSALCRQGQVLIHSIISLRHRGGPRMPCNLLQLERVDQLWIESTNCFYSWLILPYTK